MGTSTNAILFYGIDFEEEFEFPWSNLSDENGDFDDWWANEMGAKKPDGEYVSGLYDDYWKQRDDFIEQCPVELVEHSHHECPMYCLAIKGTEITCYRGGVESIDLTKPTEEQIQKLKDFLTKYNIPFEPENIGWKMVSYWG